MPSIDVGNAVFKAFTVTSGATPAGAVIGGDVPLVLTSRGDSALSKRCSIALALYLAAHGAYGFLWLLKSREFGDKQWEQPCGLGRGAVIWAALSMYWIAPWLICSRR